MRIRNLSGRLIPIAINLERFSSLRGRSPEAIQKPRRQRQLLDRHGAAAPRDDERCTGTVRISDGWYKSRLRQRTELPAYQIAFLCLRGRFICRWP